MFRRRYNRGSRMSALPPKPGRPGPQPGPQPGPKTGPKTGHHTGPPNSYPPNRNQIPPQIAEKTQPESEDGAMEDMAHPALNPRLLANLEAAATHHPRGAFVQMD